MKDHDFAYKNTIPGQLNTTESKNGLKTKLSMKKLILFIETERKKVAMATNVPSFGSKLIMLAKYFKVEFLYVYYIQKCLTYSRKSAMLFLLFSN